MLYVDVNGHKLLVPAGITAQVLHKSALFTDGLEDSYSLPFEVPVRGNEATLGHVHELPMRTRTLRYENARLGHHGLPLLPGTLHVLSTIPQSVRTTFSVDGFVQLVKGLRLPDAIRDETIDLTDEIVNQGISLHLRPLYAAGGKCQFPMYRNTELYGDANEDWYPSADTWSATQAYAQNDLVQFTEYTNYVVRTDRWQCTDAGGASAGQSPVTHPAKWRRTAFGIVNAWDRDSNQHYYNTTDNFYAFVPWFYLKWVLAKALAHIGYTAVGDFMDDATMDELVLANNTTIDASVDTESATLFEAAQTGTAYYDSSDGPNMPLPADTESPAPLQDPDSLWDASTGEFIPNTAGTWSFRIETTALSVPANATAELWVYHDGLGAPYIPVGWQSLAPLSQISVWIGPVSSTGQIAMEFSLLFDAWTVGERFRFRLYIRAGDLFTWVSWPTSGQDGVTGTRIRGWLQNAAPTISVPDTVIHPWRHVPEVDVYGFLVAIADAFNTTLEPDVDKRTLRMDYKENELVHLAARSTEHSARVVNDTEIDHQRATAGVRLVWDVDTVEDAAAMESASLCMSEQDMPIPVATGQRALARATRGAYKTIFDAASGTLAWKHTGYHVPALLVGESEGATEVKPALKPVHMVQEQLDQKEYLIPELNERGTSAWYHTDGDKGTIWISEFKKQRSADGSVTNVPGARSWGYGWNSDDTSNLMLLWDEADDEFPGLYQRQWQRWLAMLTTAEPVTMDLLVDANFLRGRDWRHAMLLHGQRYLLQEMPVEYGTREGQLMSTGAYLLRLRELAAPVPPPGAQAQFLFTSDKSGEIGLTVNTTSGYFTIKESDGTLHTYPEGFTSTGLDPGGANSAYQVWSSDADGNLEGMVEQITIQEQNVTGFTPLDLSQCTELGLPVNPDLPAFSAVGMISLTNLDLASCTNLAQLNVLQATALETLGVGTTSITELNLTSNTLLTGVWCNNCPDLESILVVAIDALLTLQADGCDIQNTDELVNALNATLADGTCDLSGGTSAARTSASDTNYNALVANNWVVNTN